MTIALNVRLSTILILLLILVLKCVRKGIMEILLNGLARNAIRLVRLVREDLKWIALVARIITFWHRRKNALRKSNLLLICQIWKFIILLHLMSLICHFNKFLILAISRILAIYRLLFNIIWSKLLIKAWNILINISDPKII